MNTDKQYEEALLKKICEATSLGDIKNLHNEVDELGRGQRDMQESLSTLETAVKTADNNYSKLWEEYNSKYPTYCVSFHNVALEALRKRCLDIVSLP